MNSTTKRVSIMGLVAGTIAASAMVLGGASAANAEPAGQYTYVCEASSGNSVTMQSGESLSDCHGSYLLQYINGQQVGSIRLTEAGTPATKSVACEISIVGTGLAVISSDGVLSWAAAGAGAYGTWDACTA